MKLKFVPFLFVALLLLQGCQSLGLTTAKSFEDRLAYGYSTYTAVVTAAANALNAKEITSDDATKFQDIARNARQLLDAAKLTAGVGDVATAEGRLQLATSLLVELQNYLRSKQP